MARTRLAVHRAIVVFDVESFGAPQRTLPHQLGTRAGLYRVIAHALRAVGVRWGDCHHEDRGDGVLVLIPPEIPKAPLVEVMPEALVQALRVHNDTNPSEQRVRLRMAVHAGEVAFDEHGATSTSLTTAFRLLDAAPLKRALADSPGVLALIVSRWVFDEVVRHSAVLDPTRFRPVTAEAKETRDTAWIALPDHPYSSDSTVLNRPISTATVVPRQLPARPAPFVGRRDELDRLDAAFDASATVVISAIAGAGGIGKTWLALHWAHRHLDRFPDGQLFVDLRGFSPDGKPMNPAVGVRGFLDALGIDPARIPVEAHAQAALFRSLVVGKRMLVVLDNAVDTTQVTPLLPGSESCMVLVTSRNQLPGLITGHAARHLPLDMLSDTEGYALLADRLGTDRLDAEPVAAEELLAFCGGFPVALSILASHAQTHPHLTLAVLVDDLRDLGLRALDGEDPTASLPAVLSWSYRALTTQQARVFTLLGIAPGPDISQTAAANLTGLPVSETRTVLRGLEHASLLTQHTDGRYRMHDLVRRHAANTAHRDLAERVREAALQRVLDYYTYTANTADRLLNPLRTRITSVSPALCIHPQPLPNTAEALAWFDAEHANLLAAQHTAVTHQWHHIVWQLAWTLSTFHGRRGHHRDALAVWRTALDAAAHLPDPTTCTVAHRHLGSANAALGRHDEAIGNLHQALTLAEHHHDRTHQALAQRALASAWEQQGENHRALDHATRALNLYRALGQPIGEAVALNEVGWHAAHTGEYNTARAHCQAALTLHQHHRDPHGEAHTLINLGYIAHHTGQHEQALDYYRRPLAHLRETGDAYHEAMAQDGMGEAHAALCQPDLARVVWREALALYRQQGRDNDATRVQRQLDALHHPDGDEIMDTGDDI